MACVRFQVSYFYVDKDQTNKDPETAGLLRAFIEYIISDEGQVRMARRLSAWLVCRVGAATRRQA